MKKIDKRHAGERYEKGAKGWLVQITGTYPCPNGPMITYWYGPIDGWGTTGSAWLDRKVRVWPTRFAAESAMRQIFGQPRFWVRRGYLAVRVSEAEASYADRQEARTEPQTAAEGPNWGEPYTDEPYRTEVGLVWMWRKGQRVRFYTEQGVQVGPEQANVAPAVAYAVSQGWGSRTADQLNVPTRY